VKLAAKEDRRFEGLFRKGKYTKKNKEIISIAFFFQVLVLISLEVKGNG
jgi:hypothetical protein